MIGVPIVKIIERDTRRCALLSLIRTQLANDRGPGADCPSLDS